MHDREMTAADRADLNKLLRDAEMDQAQEGTKNIARLASCFYRSCQREQQNGKPLYGRGEVLALTVAYVSSLVTATTGGKG